MTQRKKIDLLFEIDPAIESIVSDTDMDFCGSWCNVDVLKSMLKTPTLEKRDIVGDIKRKPKR